MRNDRGTTNSQESDAGVREVEVEAWFTLETDLSRAKIEKAVKDALKSLGAVQGVTVYD